MTFRDLVPTKLWFARQIASTVLYASFGLNLGIVIGNLAVGRYTSAGLQSILVVLLGGWIYVRPTFEAWLDAKCGAALAQRRMTERAHDEIEKHVRAGRAWFSVHGVGLN